MAYCIVDQLVKIEADMYKAGFPKSSIYLALGNECKKFMDMVRAEEYYFLYHSHKKMEDKINSYHLDTALAQQQQAQAMLAQMAQMAQEERIKRDIIRASMEIDTWVDKDSLKEKIKSAVVTEHVGRKFREDI